MRIYLEKTSTKEQLLIQKINKLCLSIGIRKITNEDRVEAVLTYCNKLIEKKRPNCRSEVQTYDLTENPMFSGIVVIEDLLKKTEEDDIADFMSKCKELFNELKVAEDEAIEKLKAKDESLLENASVRDAEIKAEIPGSEEDVERRVEAVVNSRFIEAPVVEVKAEEEPVQAEEDPAPAITTPQIAEALVEKV